MVRKNCYKYNTTEISEIVTEYMNTSITFDELSKKYNRSVRWMMNLIFDHYDLDKIKNSKRYRRYKKKDYKVMVTDDNGSCRIFKNDQEVVLWFQEFGMNPTTARQLVRRALDSTGKYQNLRITYV